MYVFKYISSTLSTQSYTLDMFGIWIKNAHAEVNSLSYGFKTAPVEVDKEYEVEITNMNRRGDSGGVKIEGFVIFVPDTKPGDKVKVKITHVGRRFASAELVK